MGEHDEIGELAEPRDLPQSDHEIRAAAAARDEAVHKDSADSDYDGGYPATGDVDE
jgi:hypothetical protein